MSSMLNLSIVSLSSNFQGENKKLSKKLQIIILCTQIIIILNMLDYGRLSSNYIHSLVDPTCKPMRGPTWLCLSIRADMVDQCSPTWYVI